MREILEHNLTIKQGADYQVDMIYTDDDEIPEDVSGWTLEAQIRDEVESGFVVPFTASADETGYHLTLNKAETRKLRFAHGVYDVFITDPDGIRTPLIQGEVNIIPEATR